MTHPVRRYRSESDWQKLIDQHAKSNLPVRAFCKQHSIGDQSFYQWRKRLQAQSNESAIDMIDITQVMSIQSSTRWHIELDLGDGIKLNLKQA